MEHIDIDDDFGDLYADVEVQASSAIHNVAATSQLSTEKNDIDNKEEVIVDNGSDSEDDLNILLNSDDEGIPFPVTCGGFEDDDVDDEEENVGLEDKNKKCVDQDALEHKGSYRSQYSLYKYIRSHPAAAFTSNSKSNGYAGVGSYSSTLERGDREDIGCNQRMRSGSLAAQRRHNFSLPRSRTILDVNIDTFERKPWRHPEADITDFFNFGFDEDSWKRYCNQLDQNRHREFISTRIPASESFKPNEAYEAGSEHETVAQEALADKIRIRHGRRISPLSKIQSKEEKHSNMQKGRAIQVEDSIGERKPSMDVRRPPHRDSDVIQINVQDSKEDSSGSDNEGLDPIGSTEHKSCENGDLGVDDSRENLCLSSGSEDELQRVDLNGHHGGLDMTASNKRCSQQTAACECVSTDSDNNGSAQISEVDVHHCREVAFRDLEIMTETIETSKNAKEKVGRNTCITAPTILGTKLSQSKHSQHKPSPSCYVTNHEASRDGAYVDTEKYRNHSKKTSPNSVTELRESVTSDYYYHSRDSRSHGIKTRLGDCKYYSRHRNPIEENSKNNNRRYNGVVRLKTRLDEGTLSDNERLYDLDHSAFGHSRENGRLHGYHSYHGEDMPHCRKSDLSFSYYGERFLEYRDGAACTKNPSRKGRRGFGVETNRHVCRNSDEGEYPLEHKISRMDDEVMDRDWYQYESEPAIVDNGLLTYRESRQLDAMYSSYIDHGRGARWKRKGEESQFRNRMENGDFFPERRYTNEKCERSVPYNKRDSDYLEYRYEGHLPYTRREVQSPGRSKRRCGSPSIGFDNLWSLSEEDEYWRVRDHVSLSSHSYKEPRTANSRRWQGTASPGNDVCEKYERHGKYRRGIWTGKSRDRGSFGGYTDAFDTEESTDDFDDRVYFERRQYWQSELLHWTEGESISRHRDDKFHADSAPFSFEKTSWHKRVDAELGSAHDGKLIDDRQIQRHRDKLIREGNNGNRFDRSSNVIRKVNHDQTLQRCWDSVVGEVKSPGRYPNARGGTYNGRHIDVEHKSSNDFTDGHTEKVVRVDSAKLEPDQNDEKWLDKFPVTQHSEALDIEEGQIITEEIKESTIPASHDLTQVSDVGELRDSKATDGKTAVEKQKNPKILEVMAKMEKRRERFKEPIILKKDVDTTPSPKIPVDSVDETAKTKQQRPTRKRRWGGS